MLACGASEPAVCAAALRGAAVRAGGRASSRIRITRFVPRVGAVLGLSLVDTRIDVGALEREAIDVDDGRAGG